MKRTAAIGLVLCLALTAGVASAKKEYPSVAGTSWAGDEFFKGTLQKFGKTSSEGLATLEFPGPGFIYTNQDGDDLFGSLTQVRNRKGEPTKKLTDIRFSDPTIGVLEEGLATTIRNALLADGIDPGRVTYDVDESSIRIKGKLKVTKAGNFLLLKIKLKGMAMLANFGPRKAGLKVKAVLAQL